MAVTSSEAFLQILKKSKLLSDEELEESLQKYGDDSDPKSIARALIKVGKINKWQALQLLGGRHALTLGKYKFLDQIGSDKKARIFLAEHTQMGRRVAIKTLSRQHATENPKSVKHFLDQASRLAALDHHNIVHVYDVDSVGDRYYVVLEHVEGVSLKQILGEQGAMPAEKVARYVSQTAAGLAYAHKKDYIHGDVRPANLLVDGQDIVKIANLGVKGLAVSEEDDEEAASTAYVASERTADDPSGDHRSDIYSLGCVMYALLTGHPPSAGEPPSVLDDRPDTPRPLATICGRMMADDPAKRYQAASEIEQQLDQWLEAVGDTKPAPSQPQAGSDSQPPKAAAPPPREKTKDKESPKQRKPLQTSKKPQAAGDSPAKPQRPSAAGAVSKKPTAAGAKADKTGEAETKAKPAVGAVGGVAINTKRRRKKGKSQFSRKAAYIIGGAVAGGLVLIAGVILLLVFVFSGDDDTGVEVAEGGNGEAATEGSTDTTDADSDPESDPEVDPEVDPVMDVAPATDAVSEPNDGSDPDGTSQDTGTEPKDGDGANAATSKPADEPGSNDAADGSAKKDVATKAKANEGDTAKAPKTTDQKPAEKKPAEKTNAKKPAAKKTPAKPTKKPFVQFPKLVSLPDLNSADATKPKNLGPVHAASDELCFIKLRGGENASRGSQRFVMRNADSGLAERDWEICWREGESGPDTKIAHLTLGDNSQLSFQWQPEAKTQSLAGHLSNCALMFSCRGESHVALLRQPTRVEGMAVDLEKSSVREDWNIDLPPDPSAIRVEITGVQGGKYTVEPAPTINADKGEAWVRLEDGGGLLSLHVETSLKRSLQVTLTPHVKLSNDGKPEKLNIRKIEQVKKQCQQAVQMNSGMVTQLQQALKAKGVPEDQKRRMIQPRLATFRSQLESAEAALKKCESLEKVLNGASLTVNLRVFFDADSTEVDLLEIGG